jgi:hypothetical protein
MYNTSKTFFKKKFKKPETAKAAPYPEATSCIDLNQQSIVVTSLHDF